MLCHRSRMVRIGVRELRSHASRYLGLVKSGETVEVTERGEVVALLVPAQRDDTVRNRLIAAGKLIPATARRGRVCWPPPVRPGPGEPTNAELLGAEREDRTSTDGPG